MKKQEQKKLLEAKLNELENQKKILMNNLKNNQIKHKEKEKEHSLEGKNQVSNERKQNNKNKVIKNNNEDKRENSNSKKVVKKKNYTIEEEYTKLGPNKVNEVCIIFHYFLEARVNQKRKK